MFCTVIDIRGDYAFVKYDESGVVSEVAIALLPFGVPVGDIVIIMGYGFMDFEEAKTFQPKVVFPDERTNMLIK